MFGTLGGPELLLILVIALIVFGPRKLPEIGKSLGKMMVEFRRASNDFKRTIEEEVEADKMRTALEAAPIDAAADTPASAAMPDALPPETTIARSDDGYGAEADGIDAAPAAAPAESSPPPEAAPELK